MTEPKLSLHRKLAQVLLEVGRIPKNGVAPQVMGGYKFVQVGDAADAIRDALAEKLLTMHPTRVTVVGQVDRTTAKGGNMTTVDLLVEWTITDAESGESIVIMSFGAGADGGDKYSGKAMTSAMKYAFLSGFLLSTGDDTEASNLPEQRARAAGAEPPAADEPATLRPAGRESEAFLGILTKAGVIRKGGAEGYKLERRETPAGPTFGFRLELAEPDESGGHKAIPQVLIPPEIATPLLADVGDPAKLQKRSVRVKGQLYQVSQPGRTSYYRLLVKEWRDDERSLPPEEPPAEAMPDAGLFSDEEQAAIDAALAEVPA